MYVYLCIYIICLSGQGPDGGLHHRVDLHLEVHCVHDVLRDEDAHEEAPGQEVLSGLATGLSTRISPTEMFQGAHSPGGSLTLWNFTPFVEELGQRLANSIRVLSRVNGCTPSCPEGRKKKHHGEAVHTPGSTLSQHVARITLQSTVCPVTTLVRDTCLSVIIMICLCVLVSFYVSFY